MMKSMFTSSIALALAGACFAGETSAGASAAKGATAPPPNGAADAPPKEKRKIVRAAPPSEPVLTYGGVEMPAGSTGAAKVVFPFEKMSLGEMFFVPDRTALKFQPYASKFSRKLEPKKFMSRNIAIAAKDGKPVLKDGKLQLLEAPEDKDGKLVHKDKTALLGTGCWRTA